MNRRDLLKSLTPLLPVAIFGRQDERVGIQIELNPKSCYIIFLNGNLVDAEAWCKMQHPNCLAGTPVYSIYPGEGQSLDEAIRIYELQREVK